MAAKVGFHGRNRSANMSSCSFVLTDSAVAYRHHTHAPVAGTWHLTRASIAVSTASFECLWAIDGMLGVRDNSSINSFVNVALKFMLQDDLTSFRGNRERADRIQLYIYFIFR